MKVFINLTVNDLIKVHKVESKALVKSINNSYILCGSKFSHVALTSRKNVFALLVGPLRPLPPHPLEADFFCWATKAFTP